MADLSGVKERFSILRDLLDERSRRLVAAAESLSLGKGGISAASRATGVSRPVIRDGIKELAARVRSEPGRSRRAGGGRKSVAARDPSVLRDLDRLLEPVAHCDAEPPLRWTGKSVRKLAQELSQLGHTISYPVVAGLLKESGYSLQAHQETRGTGNAAERAAQFELINCVVGIGLSGRQPVIAVEAKKKALAAHANSDPSHDSGWLVTGVDDDAAVFAVESIRRWWLSMGHSVYPSAAHLFVIPHHSSCHSARLRPWKLELQRLADEIGIPIAVCHFPRGTSKWSRIEHRLHLFSTEDWRGRPPVCIQVVVSLISGVTSPKSLVAEENPRFCGEPKSRVTAAWNYEFRPSPPKPV